MLFQFFKQNVLYNFFSLELRGFPDYSHKNLKRIKYKTNQFAVVG